MWQSGAVYDTVLDFEKPSMVLINRVVEEACEVMSSRVDASRGWASISEENQKALLLFMCTKFPKLDDKELKKR